MQPLVRGVDSGQLQCFLWFLFRSGRNPESHLYQLAKRKPSQKLALALFVTYEKAHTNDVFQEKSHVQPLVLSPNS